jgi:hypothetical protein
MEIRNEFYLLNDESSDRVNHEHRSQFLLSRDILLVQDPIIFHHPYT